MGQSGHGWGRAPPCANRCVASLDGYEKALSQSGHRCGRWGGGRRRGRVGVSVEAAGPGADWWGFLDEPWWGARVQEGWWAPGCSHLPKSSPGSPTPTPLCYVNVSGPLQPLPSILLNGSKALPTCTPKTASSTSSSDHPAFSHVTLPAPPVISCILEMIPKGPAKPTQDSPERHLSGDPKLSSPCDILER